MGNRKVSLVARRRKGWERYLVSICLCQTAIISISTGAIDNHYHLYSISYFTRNLYSQDLIGIETHMW